MSFPYLETVVAFALVMLVASLMVNIVVRVLCTLRGDRSIGVADMLVQLHRGFATARDLDLHGPAREAAEQAFVDAIMLSPVLHDVKTRDAIEAEYQRRMGKADRIRETDPDKARKRVAAAVAWRRDQLRRQIEHVRLGDVLAIVRDASSAVPGLPGVRVVPAAWFAGAHQHAEPPTIAQQKRFGFHEAAAPIGVNARDLHDYITRWFKAAEATASNVFGTEQRKTARAIAGVVVVLLNLDAIHLAYGLYQDRALSDRLASHAGEVVALANQLGQGGGPAPVAGSGSGSGAAAAVTMAQLKLDLQKTAAILTVEHVPIGWHDSFMSKRWCAYHHDCDDPTVPAPSGLALLLDLVVWVFGLLASWALVSLGAPFWVKVITWIPGFGNVLAKTTGDDHQSERADWSSEGRSLTDGFMANDPEAGGLIEPDPSSPP